jgi:hypothetical protein
MAKAPLPEYSEVLRKEVPFIFRTFLTIIARDSVMEPVTDGDQEDTAGWMRG